jgi:phosphoserine phosphatase RsbU/P
MFSASVEPPAPCAPCDAAPMCGVMGRPATQHVAFEGRSPQAWKRGPPRPPLGAAVERPVDRVAENVVRMLRATATFAAVSDAELAAIAGGCTLERAASGDMLFRQGDDGSWAYLVLDGQVGVEVESGGQAVTVAVIEPGEFVGELAAFASTPRTATARARTEAQLLRIDQSVVRRQLTASPETAMAIVADLSRRLQNLNSTLATLARAADALAVGDFDPAMLDTLRSQASRFSHFADVFDRMAEELLIKRAHAVEMRTAMDIQSAMLPDGAACRPLPGVSLAAAMVPARHVGGDFYDYFTLDDRRLAIAVGDVSGKGVPAALFMAIAKTVLRTVARTGGDAAGILAATNEALCLDNREAMFVTVGLALVDARTGEAEIASAGHEEVYLVTAGGTVEKIAPLGPALALFPDAAFRSRRLRLAPGDWIVIATDGVTEAFSATGEIFGNDRLEAEIARHAGSGPEDMIAGVSATITDFAAGMAQSDDLTGLALRFEGSSAGEGQPVPPA